MRVDPSKSQFQEAESAKADFNRKELRRLRYLLRRLRYLEAQVQEKGEEHEASGTQHAAWEVEALEWALTEIGFLFDPDEEVSGNTNDEKGK